jgi:hypothetical protein
MPRRKIMVDWFKPSKRKQEYDSLDDRQVFDRARQRPQQRFIPPENPRDFTPVPQQRGYDESQMPPDLRRVRRDDHPRLTERFQEQREEYREQYAPQPPPQGYQDEYVPYSKPRKSKVPIILVAASVSLFFIGAIIAAVNIIYVKNPGQTIQSLTMVHAEIVVVLLTVLINTILTWMVRK